MNMLPPFVPFLMLWAGTGCLAAGTLVWMLGETMRQEYGRRLAAMGQQVVDRLSPPLPPRMAVLAAHGTAPELSAVPSPPAIDMAAYRVPIVPGADPTVVEDKRFVETFDRFVAVTDMAGPITVSDQYSGRHRHMSRVTQMCYRLGWPVRVWYWLVLHWPGFSPKQPVRVPRSQYRPPLPARSREWTEPAVAEVQVGRSVLLRRLDSGWRDIPPPEARPFFTPAPALEASAS